METSHILSRQEFNDVIAQAGDHIVKWFKKELGNITRKKVIIREISDQVFAINTFGILKTHRGTWAVYEDQKAVHEFNYKTVACFYCLFLIDNEIENAKELLQLDYALGSLILDNEIYKNRIYSTSKNLMKKEIWMSRYAQNCQRINIIRHRLKKIIDLAKYKKTRKLYES